MKSNQEILLAAFILAVVVFIALCILKWMESFEFAVLVGIAYLAAMQILTTQDKNEK